MSEEWDEFIDGDDDNIHETDLEFDDPEWSAFVVVPSPDAQGRPAIFSVPEYLSELMYFETQCPNCNHEYPMRFKHPNDQSDTE